MRFGTVPNIVEEARPWATTMVIGPPPGRSDVGNLVAQVDEQTALGRAFRVFLEFDEGDYEKVLAGGAIEVAFHSPVMYPISTQVWDSGRPVVNELLEDEDGAPYPEGVQAIARERARQITDEGYTQEHDERHAVGQFVSTAIAYLGGRHTGHNPWPVKRAESEDGLYQRRDLVKAGALIAAAIDRLDAIEGGA